MTNDVGDAWQAHRCRLPCPLQLIADAKQDESYVVNYAKTVHYGIVDFRIQGKNLLIFKNKILFYAGPQVSFSHEQFRANRGHKDAARCHCTNENGGLQPFKITTRRLFQTMQILETQSGTCCVASAKQIMQRVNLLG